MKKDKGEKKILETLVKGDNSFPVVGIGASAGGLDAFKKLIKAIPENSGMAYVLVQHLDPNHQSFLPEILQRVTNIPVLEISDDIKVQPDHIYIIPSNKMLVASDGVLQLSPRITNKNQRNLPIDLFFASLAEVHQSHSIGIVLSGTASDGTLGLKAIKDHGGITIAQDEESATYQGMPNSAVQAGVVDFILSPELIPQKLTEITQVIHVKNTDDIHPQEEELYKQILLLLRIRKGMDFTYYKQTTVRRRILRRMLINKQDKPADYLKYLRENKQEQDILFQDMLIPVTNFFRDTKTWDNLCGTVFPDLLKNKSPDDTIRIWVAGCSTGEEAYSIAICMKELLGDTRGKVQIFASDISEKAIVKARTGIYTQGELEAVSTQRQKEFFIRINGTWQVNKQVRDMCVFAVHNFLKDPPFGKLDLISCRNVLIYMEPYLQKKALTTFHYALNPEGNLLLGKSETISQVSELFGGVAKGEKLFIRKEGPGRAMVMTSKQREENLSNPHTVIKTDFSRNDFQRTADDIMLSRYTPAGVVVNEAMDIVHFRGKTGEYLEPSPGKPNLNLLKMARTGLGFELRNIIHKAKKEKASVLKEDIPLEVNGSHRLINIEAVPLPNMLEPHYLMLFHEQPAITHHRPAKKNSPHPNKNDYELRIAQLEKELAQNREDMRSITEDQEAVNEEMQSANEELLSSSEEMQSLNEELETSKEELQSTIEELTVVNQEMVSLNEQVTNARDYAEAIVTTTREPLVILDKHLHVKTANASFYKTFLVTELQTEGRLIYELGNKQWDIPALRILIEKILPGKDSLSDFEVEHNFPIIGQRHMLLNGREMISDASGEKLILLSIQDITDRSKAAQESSMLSAVVESSEDAIISITLDGIIISWNKGAEKIYGYTANEMAGKNIKLLIPPELEEEERKVMGRIRQGKPVLHFDTIRTTKDGNKIDISVSVSPIKNATGKITGVSKIARDITKRKQGEAILKNNEEHFRELVKNLPAAVYSCDALGFINFYNEAAVKVWGRKPSIGKDKWCGSFKMFKPDGSALPLDDCPMKIAFETGHASSGEEIIIERPDGTRSIVQVFPQPLFGLAGEITGAINVGIDITEQATARMLIEVNQQELRELLEQAVTNRTAELKNANELLQQKNEELEAFNYISSHDLQEPLRKIQTFTTLLLEQESKNLSDKGKDYFDRMNKAARRMQTLIEDLLSFSLIKTGGQIIEHTNLTAIIEEVKAEMRELIDEKGATVEVHDIINAKVIPYQFHQLMQNLLSNSLKFSHPERPLRIVIKNEITDAGTSKKLSPHVHNKYCHISVKDNGIGFEQEFSEQIFQVFQRLNDKEEYPGTGIGLAIAKKIVENNHGFITATGEPNKGARFDIYLPT
jgi:two-component system, chemotaxis family, CheB/CheR fusion protein